MLRIGLTGGIGSGKTTVARIFESLDIPVYYADTRGKFLLNNDLELKEKVISAFGLETYPEGKLDPKALGAIVFNDDQALTQLNSYVHPAVQRDYTAWCEASIGQADYSLKESALLFETNAQRAMDYTVVVTAPEDIRIARVMQRDEVTEAQVRARMDKQWPEGDKVMLADFVIVNDGEHSLIEQVMALHREFSL